MARFMLEFEKPLFELKKKLEALKRTASSASIDVTQEIADLEEQITKLQQRVYRKLSPWEKVQVARHPDRPKTLDYINLIFADFMELHGDRLFRDDHSVVAGLAYLNHSKIMIVGHQKGKNARENVIRNFGMPHPEGNRKALRMMKLAEKFSLPLVCFIDTQGAYPGIGAEERGQGLAIANNLMEMSGLKTPVVVVNIGEGGSGGALAFGVGDRIFMLENAYYSVITPEGCASILWRDETRCAEAAEALKLTAQDLLRLSVVDGVIKEPPGGAHHDPRFVAAELKKVLISSLSELKKIPSEKLVESRYLRLRNVGSFVEET